MILSSLISPPPRPLGVFWMLSHIKVDSWIVPMRIKAQSRPHPLFRVEVLLDGTQTDEVAVQRQA